MRGTIRRIPSRLWLAAILFPVLTGCTIHIDCRTPLRAIPEVNLPAPDVAIAVVTKDGHVFPKRLIVRGDVHAIVWVADGTALNILFKDGSHTPDCRGPVCTLLPLPKPAGSDTVKVYEYGGTVTPADGPPVNFDPHLEVVK